MGVPDPPCAYLRAQLGWPPAVPFVHPHDLPNRAKQLFLEAYEPGWAERQMAEPNGGIEVGPTPRRMHAGGGLPRERAAEIILVLCATSNGFGCLLPQWGIPPSASHLPFTLCTPLLLCSCMCCVLSPFLFSCSIVCMSLIPSPYVPTHFLYASPLPLALSPVYTLPQPLPPLTSLPPRRVLSRPVWPGRQVLHALRLRLPPPQRQGRAHRQAAGRGAQGRHSAAVQARVRGRGEGAGGLTFWECVGGWEASSGIS